MLRPSWCSLRRKSPLKIAQQASRSNGPTHLFTPKFTCRAHPYHSARTVTQFLQPLLRLPHATGGLAAAERQELRGYLNLTEGAPAFLPCEGPLGKTHVQALSSHLSDRLLLSLVHNGFRKDLTTPPHPSLEHLWSPAIAARVTAELSAARAARLGRTDSDEDEAATTQIYYAEAGIKALSVFLDEDANITQRWAALIDQYTLYLPDRSHLHELENLPQEVAIGELLAHCVDDIARQHPDFTLDCVVDVGGGNGFLAAAAGERLGCDSVVIDPRYPGHSIDCRPRLWRDTVERVRPAVPRQQALRRRIAFFKDTQWAADVGSDPHRTAFVAKHLCGSAIDECLRHLEAQSCLPRILILAPCCFNKIQYATYCNPHFLQHVLHVHSSDQLQRVSKLTDWNMTLFQHLEEKVVRGTKAGWQKGKALLEEEEKEREGFSDGVGGCDCRSCWTDHVPQRRCGGERTVAHLVPCMHGFSQLVEALLNYGRLLWLREKGYTVQMVQYVPRCVTPKNKCLVAMRL